MAKFKAGEHEYVLAVTLGGIKAVREYCEVDLLNVMDDEGKLLKRLASDPELLVNVVYVLCKRQAVEKNVGEIDFGESMVGDAIEFAAEALMDSLADFFPSAKRKLIKAACARLNQLTELASSRLIDHIESPKLEQQLESVLDELLRQEPPPSKASAS